MILNSPYLQSRYGSYGMLSPYGPFPANPVDPGERISGQPQSPLKAPETTTIRPSTVTPPPTRQGDASGVTGVTDTGAPAQGGMAAVPMGALGTGLSLLMGVPGLGIGLGALGTISDVVGQNTSLSNMGVPGQVDPASAFANAVTFGALGQDPQEQALDLVESDPAVTSQAAAESAMGLGPFGGQGRDVGDNSAGEAKIICGELYRQGMLPHWIYREDLKEGRRIATSDPEVQVGYHLMAKPVVALMKKSRLFTRVVYVVAAPWAYEMAGQSSWWGRALIRYAVPFCRFVGNMKHARFA